MDQHIWVLLFVCALIIIVGSTVLSAYISYKFKLRQYRRHVECLRKEMRDD